MQRQDSNALSATPISRPLKALDCRRLSFVRLCVILHSTEWLWLRPVAKDRGRISPVAVVGDGSNGLTWFGHGKVNFRDRTEGSNVNSFPGGKTPCRHIVFNHGGEFVNLVWLSPPNRDWNNFILIVILSISAVDRRCIVLRLLFQYGARVRTHCICQGRTAWW